MNLLKKKTCRILAVVLVFCLCVTSMPAMAFADEAPSEKDMPKTQQEAKEEIQYKDPKDVTEEDAMLDESGKDYTVFNLGGKKRHAVFFTEDVRFENESGELQDYDPALVDISNARGISPDSADYAYENAEGDHKQYFPKELSEETPIVMESDGYTIKVSPTDKTYKDFFGKKVKIKTKKEKTEDAYENKKEKTVKASFKDKEALAYVEYTSLSNGVKEDIVLSKRPAKNILEFRIYAPGLNAEVSELDGSVGFYDKQSGNLVHMINPPNMNDASGDAYSESLYYGLRTGEEADTYILSLTIDRSYLKSKDRKYPVKIDPTQTWVGDAELRDVYVSKNSANTNFYDTARQSMPIGKGSSTTYRTFIRFFSLKSVLEDCIIDSATLKLFETEDSNPDNTVNAFRVTESWEAKTVTWANQPTTTSSRFGSCVTNGTNKHACEINAKIFAEWVAKGNSNYGIVLKANNESIQRFSKFYVSRTTTTTCRPKLSVTYTDLTQKTAGKIEIHPSNYIKKGFTETTISLPEVNSDLFDSMEYKILDANGKAVNPAGDYQMVKVPAGQTSGPIITDNLPEGKYTLYIIAYYSNGVSSQPSKQVFYIDGTKPKVKAFDAYEVENGVSVEWTVTEKYLKEVVLTVNGAEKYRGTELSGSYDYLDGYNPGKVNRFELTVTDKAGYTTTEEIVLQSDYAEPTVEETKISDQNSTAENGWFNGETPVIQFAASDDYTEITEACVSYAVKKSGLGVPDSSEYKKPSIISVIPWNGGRYLVTFIPDEKISQQGKYIIFVKVTDETGNYTVEPIAYHYDNTAPTGRIIAKNALETAESNEIYGVANITGSVDIDEGSTAADNIMELWQTVSGQDTKICEIYHNAAGSSAGSMSKDFDTSKYKNGDYVLKMHLKDKAGNTNTITKKIRIANRISEPSLKAKSANKSQAVISYVMPESVKEIKGLQYKVEETQDGKWIDVPSSNTLSGSFIAELPQQEGRYKVSVRAVDMTGVGGKESTVTIRLDKTAPVAEISSALQGIIKGTASDDEFAYWKIYIKEKDAADDAYKVVLEGEDLKENDLFGSISLYNAEYPGNTWYTIKLEAADAAGNVTAVTEDIYKNEDYPAVEIVEPDFRITRPEYQSYTVPQIVFPDTEDKMTLTADFFRTFTLGSADWFVDNNKAAVNQPEYSLKNEDGSAKYQTDMPYKIAAVARGPLDGAHYSNKLIKNAEVQEVIFGNQTEIELTFKEAVSFTLTGSAENCTYYVKIPGGEYKKVVPGETVEFLELSEDKLTETKLVLKAEAAEGSSPSDLLAGFDQLQSETFEISGIESYRPNRLSAKDKINYKTYLKWGIPENLPEDISYEVYRSTEKNFDPQLIEPVAEVKTGYYVEPNADYQTTFYYRVRAVKKNAEGKIIARSSFSDQAASTVVDEDEFLKRMGYKEYWSYTDFDMPMGSGYIEKSEGNFMYEQTDASLDNEQMGVELTRTYNSRATSRSSFGIGWNHAYDIELLTTDYSEKLEEGERIVMRDSSGTMFFFSKEPNGSGEYISSMGRYLKLRKLADAEKTITVQLPDRSGGSENGKISVTLEAAYIVETKEDICYYFNEGGQLIHVTEPNGNFLLFDYDINSGLTAKITTSKNLSMEFTYNDKPGTDPTTVKQVLLPDGSSMEYHYSDGMLTSAVKKGTGGSGGITYHYGYDSEGKLNTLKDADGNSYSLSYEKGGMLKTAAYPDGQSINRKNGAETCSVVTTVEKDGVVMIEETALFNESFGNCLRVTDGKGLTTTYEYRDNMLSRTVSETAYETVENGVVTEKTDTHVTTTEYDTVQNVTAEESGYEQWSEVVDYAYDFTGEYDEDLPSGEEVWCDGELISDIEYDYDDYGNLVYEFDGITDTLTEYDYYTENEEVSSDLYGELASETESVNGAVQSKTTYSYTYDAAGNKTETAEEVCGDVTTVTVTRYDNMGRELSNTVTVNGTVKSSTENEFDLYGRVIKTVTVSGNITTTVVSSYTANGAVASETTTVNDGSRISTTETVYTYDSMNRVKSQTVTADGKSKPETTEYAYGTVDEKGAFGGGETVYAKITLVTSGSMTVKTFEDPYGNIIREDTGGTRTYYTYDRSGNRTGQVTLGENETLQDGTITAFAYDQRGNQTHVFLDAAYDAETGTFSKAENTVVTQTAYDGQNRAVKSVDGKGIVTENTYDTEGRMTSVIQDASGSRITTTVSYTEPASGDNTSSAVITMAGGSKSRTVTDVQGQTVLESTIGGDRAIEKKYQYNDSGNVLKQTDSAGNFRTYEYDSADRQTAVNYFDENGVQEFRTEFAYDPQGNITVMEDYRYENGSKVLYRYTEKQYDGFGRMISEAEADCNGTAPSETDLSAGRITYTYDNDDRLTAVSYPSAFGGISGLTYEYGEYNRLLAIKAEDQVLREYTYGAKGEILSIKDRREALGGTGYTVKAYEYDRMNRPVSITVTDSEKEGTIEAYTYQYDANSQIIKETRMNLYPAEGTGRIDETWNYVYDNLGRLLQTTVVDDQTGETKTQKAYTYDDAGNRLTETENGQTTVNTYNLLNQMVTGGDTSYSYDANGNLKEESSADLVKQYTYDADNRLDTAVFTEKGQKKVEQKNTYNGEGQRISKTENGIATNYSYQNGSVVYTDGGEKNRSFNIMGDAGNVIASEREDGAYFYNKDMRSSTTTVTDGSGNCKAAYEYTDFGETKVNSDFYNEIAYTGGIWDQSTGLYYLNARYYDPDDGRFLTEDTIRPDAENAATWHLYAYCANNPVNYVDPSGHFALSAGVVAGIVGALVAATAYMSTPQYQSSWRNFCTTIGNGLSSISKEIKKTTSKVWKGAKSYVKKVQTNVQAYTKIAKAQSNIREKSKKKNYKYFNGYFNEYKKYQYISIGNGISFEQAKSRVRRQKNVFAINKQYAKSLANRFKGVIGPEIDKGKAGVTGYYYHYHVQNRKNRAHIWYLGR